MNARKQRHLTFPLEHGLALISQQRTKNEVMPVRPLWPPSLPEPVFGVGRRTELVSSEGSIDGFTLESMTTLRTWTTTRLIRECQFGRVMLAMEVTEPALAGREGAKTATPLPVYVAIKVRRCISIYLQLTAISTV